VNGSAGAGAHGDPGTGSSPLDALKQIADAIGGLYGDLGPIPQICEIWKEAAAMYFGALAACLEGGPGDPDPNSVTVTISVAGGGVLPAQIPVSGGLRALGWGPNDVILPADISMQHNPGTVDVTVNFGNVIPPQKQRTVIYQGVLANKNPTTNQVGPPLTVTVVKPAFSA
jgi:hypothetical protein